MFRLFRTLRRRLSKTGDIKKYLWYAFGELVLVVLGILIALQINNWNQEQVQEREFTGLIEQIYNAIHIDSELHRSNIRAIQVQIDLVNQLLNHADSIPDNQLLTMLFYLDDFLPPSTYSRGQNLLPFLDYQSKDGQQQEIIRRISSHALNTPFIFGADLSLLNEVVTPLLRAESIPQPNTIFFLTANAGFTTEGLFDEEDVARGRSLLQTRAFRAALKSSGSKKLELVQFLTNDLEAGLSILKLIKEYHPEAQLLFDDLGIVGDATAGGWFESTPMQKVNDKGSVWEIVTELQAGGVKFRNRNSWDENWGGTTFPEGQLDYFGQDISIVPGRYRIRIDLEKRTYMFIAL